MFSKFLEITTKSVILNAKTVGGGKHEILEGLFFA